MNEAMPIPQQQPVPDIASAPDPGESQYFGRGLPYGDFGVLETFGALVQQDAMPDSLIGGSVFKYAEKLRIQEQNADQPMVDPGELNQRFPGMEEPFKQPMSAGEAEYLHSLDQDRKARAFIIENGAFQGPVASVAANLAASLIGQLTSPSSWVVNLATGGAGGAALAAKMAPSLAGRTLLAGAGRTALGGMIENTALDPVSRALEGELQQTAPGWVDRIGGVLEGGAVAGIMHGFLHTAFRGVKGYAFSNEGAEALPNGQYEAANRLAVAQHADDRFVDMRMVMDDVPAGHALDEVKAQLAPETRIWHDSESEARINALPAEAPLDLDLSELDQHRQALDQRWQAMESQGLLSESAIAKMEEFKTQDAEMGMHEKLVKAASFCLGGGL